MQIPVIFALPLWCPLSRCPGQLPQYPTPPSTSDSSQRITQCLRWHRPMCQLSINEGVINSDIGPVHIWIGHRSCPYMDRCPYILYI